MAYKKFFFYYYFHNKPVPKSLQVEHQWRGKGRAMQKFVKGEGQIARIEGWKWEGIFCTKILEMNSVAYRQVYKARM